MKKYSFTAAQIYDLKRAIENSCKIRVQYHCSTAGGKSFKCNHLLLVVESYHDLTILVWLTKSKGDLQCEVDSLENAAAQVVCCGVAPI